MRPATVRSDEVRCLRPDAWTTPRAPLEHQCDSQTCVPTIFDRSRWRSRMIHVMMSPADGAPAPITRETRA